jgi:hypothetical protein
VIYQMAEAFRAASDKWDWITQIRPHATNRTRSIFQLISLRLRFSNKATGNLP